MRRTTREHRHCREMVSFLITNASREQVRCLLFPRTSMITVRFSQKRPRRVGSLDGFMNPDRKISPSHPPPQIALRLQQMLSQDQPRQEFLLLTKPSFAGGTLASSSQNVINSLFVRSFVCGLPSVSQFRYHQMCCEVLVNNVPPCSSPSTSTSAPAVQQHPGSFSGERGQRTRRQRVSGYVGDMKSRISMIRPKTPPVSAKDTPPSTRLYSVLRGICRHCVRTAYLNTEIERRSIPAVRK